MHKSSQYEESWNQRYIIQYYIYAYQGQATQLGLTHPTLKQEQVRPPQANAQNPQQAYILHVQRV